MKRTRESVRVQEQSARKTRKALRRELSELLESYAIAAEGGSGVMGYGSMSLSADRTDRNLSSSEPLTERHEQIGKSLSLLKISHPTQFAAIEIAFFNYGTTDELLTRVFGSVGNFRQVKHAALDVLGAIFLGVDQPFQYLARQEAFKNEA